MSRNTCPLGAREVLDRYFLENRARVVELAAFLDRLDRARDAEAGRRDFRHEALMRALGVLLKAEGRRAEAVLRTLSDPTSGPLETAVGAAPAAGAWKGESP